MTGSVETPRPSPISADVLRSVDEVFARFHSRGRSPALAYGVVADGIVVATGGHGLVTERAGIDSAEAAMPGAAHVFRLASITKSFTAAAVLLLRDRDAVDLDAPVTAYVPGLRLVPVQEQMRPPTVRQLLTMSSGLPTDDPWADRLESTEPAAFDAMSAEGFRLAWEPGSRFEYSNLGYVLLGRIVSLRSGQPYRDFVSEQLLAPLGLVDTSFDPATVDPDRLVTGFVRSGDGWRPVPFSGPGEFSALGGLCSTVTDLGRWVGYLLDAARHETADADEGPLCRASRREMQRMQVVQSVAAGIHPSNRGMRPDARAVGYGYGLFVESDGARGRVVRHSGGYPGFGSHMCWHPETGLGVVALANGTYAGPSEACGAALDVLLGLDVPVAAAARTAASAAALWPETRRAQSEVDRLLDEFDDERADRLFAPNVDLDLPRDERRRLFAAARDAAGGTTDGNRLEYSNSPAHLRWLRPGRAADRVVEILLTPEATPRVQTVDLRIAAHVPEPIARIADHVVAALRGGEPVMTGLPVRSALTAAEASAVERGAAVATALGATLGWEAEPLADPPGDAAPGTVVVRVTGDTTDWHLLVRLAADSQQVEQLELRHLPTAIGGAS